MEKSGIIDRFIRYVKSLEDTGLSPRQMEIKAGLSNGVIGKWYAEGDSLPSTQSIEKFLNAFPGLNSEWLLLGKGEMLEKDHVPIDTTTKWAQEPALSYLSGKNIRPVTVVVNQHGRELMTYVTVKAQAGYMKGYGDPHFLEKLPAFSLPILKDGAYRMFEVDGDSMLQLGGGGLHDGDIVIAQYLEDIFTVRDNRVYVVISTEGVVVKRILNRLKDKENPVLICNSDNKNGQYSAIILRAHEILEVWELKAFISRQLSFSTDLWQVINDLQVQQALLKDKVEHLEGNRLLP